MTAEELEVMWQQEINELWLLWCSRLVAGLKVHVTEMLYYSVKQRVG